MNAQQREIAYKPVDQEVDRFLAEVEAGKEQLEDILGTRRDLARSIEPFDQYFHLPARDDSESTLVSRYARAVGEHPFARGTFSTVSRVNIEFYERHLIPEGNHYRDETRRVTQPPDSALRGRYVQKELFVGKAALPLEIRHTKRYKELAASDGVPAEDAEWFAEKQSIVQQTEAALAVLKRQVLREFLATYVCKPFLPVVGYLRSEAPAAESHNGSNHTVMMTQYGLDAVRAERQDESIGLADAITEDDFRLLEMRLEDIDKQETLPTIKLFQEERQYDLKSYAHRILDIISHARTGTQRSYHRRKLARVAETAIKRTHQRAACGFLDEDLKPENFLVGERDVDIIDAGGFFLKPELASMFTLEQLALINNVQRDNDGLHHVAEGFLSPLYAPTRRLGAFAACDELLKQMYVLPASRDEAWHAHAAQLVERCANDGQVEEYDDIEGLGNIFAYLFFGVAGHGVKNIVEMRERFMNGESPDFRPGDSGAAIDPAAEAYRTVLQAAMRGDYKNELHPWSVFMKRMRAAGERYIAS